MRRGAWIAHTQGRLLGLMPLPLLIALAFGMTQDLVSGWILLEPRAEMGVAVDSLQTEFLRANRLLADGRPADALIIYDSLLETDSGLHSGAVHYNAGIAAQSMNRLGSAKAHYLGATSFRETREAAIAAMAQVDQLLPFNMARIPRYPWQKAYDVMTDTLGAQFILIAGSMGLYLACLGGMLWIFTSLRRTGRGLCVSGLGIFVVALGIALTLERELDRHGTAVVISPTVTLAEDPGSGLESTQLAYEGAVATLDLRRSAEYPGWFLAVLENGSRGWLRREDLQRVFHPATGPGAGAGSPVGAGSNTSAATPAPGVSIPADGANSTSTPIP